MLAFELISNTILPLNSTDTIEKALKRMNEFKVYHLPIVSGNQYLGLVAEEELLANSNHDIAVGALPLNLFNTFTYDKAHIYEVIRLFSDLQLSVVPVLDQKRNYLGLISVHSVLKSAATLYAVNQPGGVIVLAISNRNNSLAHMAQIVESDNAQILSSYVKSFPNSTKLEVTLKINRTDLASIVASFERYDYEVKEVFSNVDYDDGSLDRYNAFMNYLNV